jgi:hypothetical protein
MAALGQLEARRGRFEEAVALLEEALAGQERVHGDGSSEAEGTRAMLAKVRRHEAPE